MRPNRVKLVERDHPRMCGEKSAGSASPEIVMGSPPHVRGKELLHVDNAEAVVDHPRMCGEKNGPIGES